VLAPQAPRHPAWKCEAPPTAPAPWRETKPDPATQPGQRLHEVKDRGELVETKARQRRAAAIESCLRAAQRRLGDGGTQADGEQGEGVEQRRPRDAEQGEP